MAFIKRSVSKKYRNVTTYYATLQLPKYKSVKLISSAVQLSNSKLSSSPIKEQHKALLDKILLPYPAVYNGADVESGWYNWWKQSGYFKPISNSSNAKREVFSIILPPPNVTGTLHLGHALTVTIQDVLVRWYRMKGKLTEEK